MSDDNSDGKPKAQPWDKIGIERPHVLLDSIGRRAVLVAAPTLAAASTLGSGSPSGVAPAKAQQGTEPLSGQPSAGATASECLGRIAGLVPWCW